MKRILPFLLAAFGILTGCATYNYRVLQPVNPAAQVTDRPITIMYEPLEYRLSRYQDRLGMTVINPTTNQIVLRGDRSYVVDPRGESHPVRGRIIAPHSYVAMLWPPPAGGEVMAPLYGPGYYPPPGYPYPYPYGGYYYGPGFTFYRVYNQYDWHWDAGQAHIHLTYEEYGRDFDHDFVILREVER